MHTMGDIRLSATICVWRFFTKPLDEIEQVSSETFNWYFVGTSNTINPTVANIILRQKGSAAFSSEE